METKLNVLYCSDQNYFGLLKLSIFSLLRNNRNLDIHIFTMDAPHTNQQAVTKEQAVFLNREIQRIDPDTRVILHDVKGAYEKHLRESVNDSSEFTPYAALRLLFFEVFKESGIGRLLYLDCDTIICGDIREINMDIFKNAFISMTHRNENLEEALIEEDYRSSISPKNINESDDHWNLNSGMMYINIDNFREHPIVISKIIDVYNNFKLSLPDQLALAFTPFNKYRMDTCYNHTYFCNNTKMLHYDIRKNKATKNLIYKVTEELYLNDILDDSLFYLILNKMNELAHLNVYPIIPRLQFQVVDHCNLNCVSCMTASPLAKPYFADINEFEKDLRRMSDLTGKHISTFGLLGGEPLLHPNIGDFAEMARIILPNTDIRIVTNMLLIKKMDAKFYKQVVDSNIQFECSIYFTKDKYDYEEAFSFMKQKGIDSRNIIVLTRGVRSFHNISLNLAGYISQPYRYESCDVRDCLSLKSGKLYHCPVSQNAIHIKEYFGLEKEQLMHMPDDYIDIYSCMHPDDIAIFMNNPSPFCGYCDVNKKNNSPQIPYRQSKRLLGEWTGEIWE